MNVIIPVAGEGTRLRPHTHSVPKSLLYVAGKPILGHILDGLQGLDISNLSVVLGAKGEAIVDFCSKYPYDFKYVLQEQRLGLGHAIRIGAQGLQGPTLVVLGDTIIDIDYGKIVDRSVNVLAVREVADPRKYGVVEVKNDYVVDLIEKPRQPRSNLAIVGLYYFQDITKVAHAVDYIIKNEIKTRNEYQLTDALRHLLERGEKFKVWKIDGWYDCGTAEALIDANRHLLERTNYYVDREKNIIIPPVYIADSASLSASVIGPYVSIGEDVTVTTSVIKDSIINRGASVENALLTGSIIGERACVRGGYKKLSVSESSVVEIP